MDAQAMREQWLREESIAHIHGWDFSHINGRYDEENDFPWDYRQIVKEHLQSGVRLLDCDTGGGEFLLSLGHPHALTAATEGYPPNVKLCQERLLPLGIDFRPCSDPSALPFGDAGFDLVINRHGSYDPAEVFRVLRPGGLFISQQVGADNDRELVEAVLPGSPRPFPLQTMAIQRRAFQEAGFEVLRAEESFQPIVFYDVGAFVWFARIIEWEFPGFSVEACLPALLRMQQTLEERGRIEGTTHRFLLVARKPVGA